MSSSARLSQQPSFEGQIFNAAVDIVQGLPKAGPIQSSYDEKLAMYSLYKQATEGNATMPRPGMFDMLGRAKWDAWDKQKDMSMKDAMIAYVDVLLQVLRKYPDLPQAQEYVRQLESRRGVVPQPARRGRQRRGSESSTSSNSSVSSFHEASEPEPVIPELPSVPQPLLPPPHIGIGVPRADHIPSPSYAPPAQRTDAILPQSAPWERRRRDSDSSSIALGGDAASHHQSRPGSAAGGSLRGSFHHMVPLPSSAPGYSGRIPEVPLYRHVPNHDGERQLRQAIEERMSAQPSQPSSGPSQSTLRPPSTVTEKPLPRSPFLSPLGTPQYNYRERLSPVATFHPSPYQHVRQGADRGRPSLDGFVRSFTPGVPPNIDLPLALQQIQTSLTALHERISSLEQAQTLLLSQPADPFTALLHIFMPGTRYRTARTQQGGARRKPLPIRVLWRLLGTTRRAAVDILFVLIFMGLSIGIWAGIKGRGRGGRTAMMNFWRIVFSAGRSVVGLAGPWGRLTGS